MKIPELCPILGIKLRHAVGEKTGQDCSPSFDRVKPEFGYVTGNVRIISFRANRIKSNGTAEEHRKIAAYIENHDAVA